MIFIIKFLRPFVHTSKQPMDMVSQKTHDALRRMYEKTPNIDGGKLKTLVAW